MGLTCHIYPMPEGGLVIGTVSRVSSSKDLGGAQTERQVLGQNGSSIFLECKKWKSVLLLCSIYVADTELLGVLQY